VLFVAGEASGDLHAAGVAAELARLRPDLALTGVGGSRMRDAGVELLEDMGRMAVMGFVEVLRHVPAHYALLRRLRARLRSGRVALLVLVDYPGFNLRVAAEARRAGVPVLYFITPQVWAWRKHRLRGMARVITRAAVILPFEEKLLRGAGIDAAFVGHPLLDRATALPDDPAERRRASASRAAVRCSRSSQAVERRRSSGTWTISSRRRGASSSRCPGCRWP
jgi:lipid-A-disaccharide synthase